MQGEEGRTVKKAALRRDLAADIACANCDRTGPASNLDRHLWCERCIQAARERARRVGWVCGAVLASALALWIYLVQQPSRMLIGGWLGAVLATFWLGGRAGMEVTYGVLRFRGRPQ